MKYLRHGAPYSCPNEDSDKRIYNEFKDLEGVIEYPFLKDRERIICSVAFRRLEYKTQVFVNDAGDHYRTRLTHSLEVASIAKSISRILGLNEDLCEVIALAHDLGHPPFGHAGEDALSEMMADYGGFNHNLQTLKIVSMLEDRHARFSGLNLTLDVLEGLIKHNGPLKVDNDFKESVKNFFGNHIELESNSSLESQVASIADDIAYCTHDIDDGVRSGLMSIDDVLEIEIISSTSEEVKEKYPGLVGDKFNGAVMRGVRKKIIEDLIFVTKANIKHYKIKSLEDVRKSEINIVNNSSEIQQEIQKLKQLLRIKLYRNEKINEIRNQAHEVITFLFNAFMNSSDYMPQKWVKKMKKTDKKEQAVIVCDYIAGMTDRFAIKEYQRLSN